MEATFTASVPPASLSRPLKMTVAPPVTTRGLFLTSKVSQPRNVLTLIVTGAADVEHVVGAA